MSDQKQRPTAEQVAAIDNIQELRDLAKSLGLSAGGGKDALRERILSAPEDPEPADASTEQDQIAPVAAGGGEQVSGNASYPETEGTEALAAELASPEAVGAAVAEALAGTFDPIEQESSKHVAEDGIREDDRAWWCPRCDHSSMKGVEKCAGCGYVREASA